VTASIDAAQAAHVAREQLLHDQHVAMTLTGFALAEGGRLVIGPDVLANLPLGVLAFAWPGNISARGGGLDVIYVPTPGAFPSEDIAELATMALVHQAGGVSFTADQVAKIIICNDDPSQRVAIQFVGGTVEIELQGHSESSPSFAVEWRR